MTRHFSTTLSELDMPFFVSRNLVRLFENPGVVACNTQEVRLSCQLAVKLWLQHKDRANDADRWENWDKGRYYWIETDENSWNNLGA